jgi:hypothetical protein
MWPELPLDIREENDPRYKLWIKSLPHEVAFRTCFWWSDQDDALEFLANHGVAAAELIGRAPFVMWLLAVKNQSIRKLLGGSSLPLNRIMAAKSPVMALVRWLDMPSPKSSARLLASVPLLDATPSNAQKIIETLRAEERPLILNHLPKLQYPLLEWLTLQKQQNWVSNSLLIDLAKAEYEQLEDLIRMAKVNHSCCGSRRMPIYRSVPEIIMHSERLYLRGHSRRTISVLPNGLDLFDGLEHISTEHRLALESAKMRNCAYSFKHSVELGEIHFFHLNGEKPATLALSFQNGQARIVELVGRKNGPANFRVVHRINKWLIQTNLKLAASRVK